MVNAKVCGRKWMCPIKELSHHWTGGEEKKRTSVRVANHQDEIQIQDPTNMKENL
jgi:hypothetical protein